ncbi:hypothetical protein HZH68_015020 [Vespula germanica]|uniref:Ionotropic glutamate receptor L-glutamate and glycine-binding domain-containing protein n=1 Tax=Vespula germanica TaxID=30212 RepID=A0A834J8T3_VESGE|nr:hypothetical protein HZH68_015020 [Vespula germanica]
MHIKLENTTLQLKTGITTTIFKLSRVLSWEGIMTANLYFSQLHKSSYYFKQIVRPYYIVVISNYNAINEFSLATSAFDMSSAVWLVIFISKENDTDYCHNPPGNIFHLRFNSEMLVRCGTENILREWYSIDTNQIEIKDVATWSLEKGINKMVPDYLYERRYNLQGSIMKAVIIKTSLFSNINKDGELDGLFGRILRELSVSLNFSFNIVSEMEEHGRWNAKEKTWSGGIGELYAGRADIVFAAFSINDDRLNAVDFTLPIFVSKNCFFIREPENLAIKWSSYFLTFTHSVWIAMFGLLIGASVFLIILKMNRGTDRKRVYLFTDNFLEIWGIFCQQGLADFSHRSSLRIAYFSIFLWVTVLWAVYSAALISFLTSVIHVLPFDSLESFVADGTYQLAVVRGTAYYDKFVNSKDPLAKKVMKLMLEEDKLPRTEIEGFKRICENEKLALYMSDQFNSVENLKRPCNMIRIETGYVKNFAMILSKHNPFTSLINFQLQKFMDNGMMNRLKDTSFKKKSIDMVKYQPTANSSKFPSIGDEQIPFITDICKLYGPKSVIFLYAEMIEEMKMTTMVFKSRRALSREGVLSTNLYFSQMHETSYYLKQTIRPYYIALISNPNAINEFSLATSTFDMSKAVWLVIFINKENNTNYCHNPPSNIFHLKFNSEMMVRCGTENILREWYSIDTNQMEINDVATWSLQRGITKIVPDFLYARRFNLKGLIMKAVIVKTSLLSTINKDGKLDGIFGKILKELCHTLNFSFNIVSEVEEFGRWNSENKTWSGGIGELYTGRADISISDFIINNDRFNAVDFTHSLFNYKNILVIRKPKNLAIQWCSYFSTFTLSVWFAVFGVLIVSSIFLVLLKRKSDNDRKIGYLLIDNLLEIWGIFCQQGLPDFPDKSSLRIIYFSIFLFIIVFWAGYSASLISILTSVDYILPFDSLEGFAADGTYQLVVARYTAYYDKFADSKDPLTKKVMKLTLREKGELPITEFEGFKKVCKNGKLALYMSDQLHHFENLSVHRPHQFSVRIQESNNINIHLTYVIELAHFRLQKFIDNEMEMTTMMFNLRHSLSHEGIASTNWYFSQLQESSYYLKQIVQPYFIVLISNYNTINDFSFATRTFDMSSAMWLVIFIYKENSTDYCHNPPGNIFHLRFNTEMMIRCDTENILREWYSIDTNQIEINDVATWSLERGITKLVPDFIYKRRNNLKGLIIRAVIVKTFSYSVWIAMFGVIIGTTILLVFLKIESGTDRKIGHLLIDNFLEIWGIFCQQGLADFTYIFSLRIAYFSIFILIIVFWASYSAALISFLTSVNHILPFDSLEDFVAVGTHQLVVTRGTAYYDKFAISKDPFAEKVMKLMLKEENLPITEFEAFERVR